MTTSTRPTIKPLPNGPYMVKNLEHCSNRLGPVETRESMAFCRCGASSNKPFCDGTHKKINFSSQKEEGRTEDKLETYAGKQITIHDNRGLCAHAGLCTDKLASVFRMKQELWIDPEGANVEEIIATIKLCPSGALSYSVDTPEQESNGASSVKVAPGGPYVVTGEVDLLDAEWGDGASQHSYTLCRCGASKNKPFCDGSHWAIEFTDD